MLSSQAAVVLKELRQRGVYLWIEGGQIRYGSPPGAFTPELKAQVSALRNEILYRLQSSPELMERAPEIAGAELVWKPTDLQQKIASLEGCMNVAAAAAWNGTVDLDEFRAALEQILKRHAILRARYLRDQTSVTWVVTERSVHVPIRFEDFRPVSEASRHKQALMFAGNMVAEPFDVTVAPLMRAAILVLGDSAAWFLFVVHHSLFDAASRNILLAEFLALYRAGLGGEPSPLAEVSMQYSDFARKQRTMMSSSRGLRTIQYWKSVYAGPEPLFSLPYQRPKGVGMAASRVGGKLPAAVLDGLQAIARRDRTSLFMVVAAVFGIVLSRWSSRSAVAFLILNSGRQGAEYANLLGLTGNDCPLCMDLAGDPTFHEALRRVHDSYVRALPHAYVTSEMLGPRWSGAEQDGCCPKIFFNFTPYDRTYGALGTQQVGSGNVAVDEPPVTRKQTFALAIEIIESSEHLFWRIAYRGDLFDVATIHCVSDCLARVFSRVSQDGCARLSELIPDDIDLSRPESPQQ